MPQRDTEQRRDAKKRRALWVATGLILPPLLLTALLANLNSWRAQATRASGGEAFQVAFSPDGTQLAVASHGAYPVGHIYDAGWVDVWRVSSPGRFAPPRLSAHRALRDDYPASICFSGDGSKLICTGYDAHISQWNARTGELIGSFLKQGDGATGQFAQAWPKRDSFSYWTGGRVEQRRLQNGATTKRVTPRVQEADNWLHEQAPGLTALSPDGKTVALAMQHHHQNGATSDVIVLTDSLTRQTRRITRGATSHGDCFSNALTFSPDGASLIAVRNYSSPAQVTSRAGSRLNVRTGRELLRWREDHDVNAYAFSPDGALLATARDARSVLVRNARDASVFRELPVPCKRTVSIAFSPNGQTLAAVGSDGRVYLWHMK